MEQQIPQQIPPTTTPPKNWLVESILATIFCCLLGIVGIIFAAQVNSKWATGDYAGAQLSSKNAKTWTLIAFGIGILQWILIALLYGSIIMMAIKGQPVD